MSSSFASQLRQAIEKQADKYKRETYVQKKHLNQELEERKYTQYVKNQINCYLTVPSKMTMNQIIIIIHNLITIITPLNESDRQSLLPEISNFIIRFNNCMPSIDLRNRKTQRFMNEVNDFDSMFKTIKLPINFLIDMDTSNDDILAQYYGYD